MKAPEPVTPSWSYNCPLVIFLDWFVLSNDFNGNYLILRSSISRFSRVQRQLLVVLGGSRWSIRHAGWAPFPSEVTKCMVGRSLGRLMVSLSLSPLHTSWLPKFPPFQSSKFQNDTALLNYIHSLHIKSKAWVSIQSVPSVGVKEGLSCVIFRALVARKTPNLALPSLQHSVDNRLIFNSVTWYFSTNRHTLLGVQSWMRFC